MMKPTNLLFACLFAVAFVANGQEIAIPKRAMKQIRAEDLKKTMTVLTSDSLEGRATGEPGADKAASYIARCYAQMGLQPYEGGSYFQTFQLWSMKYGVTKLTVNGQIINGDDKIFNIGTVPVNEPVTKELVFAGIGADSILSQMDLNNKVVLLLFENLSKRLAMTTKIYNRGAFAVIGVNPSNDTQFADARNGALKLRSYMSMTVRKPVIQETGLRQMVLDNSQLPLLIGKTASELKDLAAHIDPKNPLGSTLELSMPIGPIPVEAKNVIGVWKGTDSKLAPIAVTAHYDHVGRQLDGSVCLGADDNASGVSTVLEVAESFSKLKERPAHDIYFVAFTAEELGLYGSAHFMENKTKEDFFANINIDMIGRHDTLTKDNYVYVLGTDKTPWAQSLHQKANAQTVNLKLDYHYNVGSGPNSFMNRSDHYQFYKRDIPVISFFSGLHGDYHTPRDTKDKIDFPLMTKRVKLVFATLYLLSYSSSNVAN